MTHLIFASDASRWAAISSRNPDAKDRFVYCVKTTKIFCRPTCPARLARRSNVEYFDNASQAEAAGYRACKRCQPTLSDFVPNTEKSIRKVTLILDQLHPEAPVPSLETLAREAGMTKYHFHRSFKKLTGCTPRDYALAGQQKQRVASSHGADLVQIPTPSLSDDISLFLDNAETPSYGFSPYTGLHVGNPPELDTLMPFDGFDWQDIHIPELDEYIDAYVEKNLSS